jgi:hypothetical protein
MHEVLVSVHTEPYQVCKHNLVYSYPHTVVAISYKPPLPEHYEETRSLHLIVASSNPCKQQEPRQDGQ